MDDSDVFAVLFPIGKHCCDAFGMNENDGLRLESEAEPENVLPPGNWSQRSTPPPSEGGDSEDLRAVDNLYLKFSQLKDHGKGWMFGTASTCDVILRTNVKGVSRFMFFITVDSSHRILLRNHSAQGMSVAHNDQNGKEIRNHFNWILFEPGQPSWQEIIINVPSPKGIRFRIVFPNHLKGDDRYNQKLKNFIQRRETEGPPMHQLHLYDSQPQTQTPSKSQTPTQNPVYVKQRLLGKGGYGEVHKAFNVGNGKIVARKELKTSSTPNDSEKYFWREVETMKSVQHPNLAELIDFEKSPTKAIIMRYYPEGSLRSKMPFYPEDRREVFRQTLMGLSYLHSHKIVHRDLKPDNILVESLIPFTIVLADFGFSRYLDSEVKDITAAGTGAYMAPELIFGDKYCGPPMDIYSAGVTMLDVNYIKWEGKSMRQVAAELAGNDDKTKRLFAQMLNEDEPKARPTADECLEKGCEIGIFKKIEREGREIIVDIIDWHFKKRPEAAEDRTRSLSAKLPTTNASISKNPTNPVPHEDLPEKTVGPMQGSQISKSRQINPNNSSADSFRSLFSDRTARAGQSSPQTSAIHVPKQTSQAPSRRSDRSRSPLLLDGQQRTDASRASNPSNFTPRVTRSAAAAERESHKPYTIPPVGTLRGSLASSVESRDTLEKKAEKKARFWSRK